MARSGGLPNTQVFSCILVVCLVGVARSDFASDQAECASQLVSLSTCLAYMQGKAKAPTTDCCSGLKHLIDTSKKCLCILVKDRNDPQLGFKVNATVALNLPKTCNTQTNASECIDLLHLSPNAPEAQIFKQIPSGSPSSSSSDNGKSSSTPASLGSSSPNGSSGQSGGGQRKWLVTVMVFSISIWCFASLLVLGG